MDAMDGMVMARGAAQIQPDGATIRVLHITDLPGIRTAQSRTLAELAEEQHVEPLASIEDLGGDPIDDIEDFLAAIAQARSGEA